MAQLGPRIVVSAVGSGAGKTTLATGLMAAFRKRGLRVASAKVARFAAGRPDVVTSPPNPAGQRSPV